MKGQILVVEDDASIGELVLTVLSQAGFRCRHVRSADAAAALLLREKVDLLLLDIGLPGISGIKLLQAVREEPGTAGLPVILISSRNRPVDKVAGLRAGADDYLGKPFTIAELLARAEAVLRRVDRPVEGLGPLEGGGVRLDLDRQEASVSGERVALRPLEFKLLSVLMRRKGFVFSYAALSEALSEGGKVMTSENLYAQTKNLRRALGRSGRLIETVHGVGYKFAEA